MKPVNFSVLSHIEWVKKRITFWILPSLKVRSFANCLASFKQVLNIIKLLNGTFSNIFAMLIQYNFIVVIFSN